MKSNSLIYSGFVRLLLLIVLYLPCMAEATVAGGKGSGMERIVLNGYVSKGGKSLLKQELFYNFVNGSKIPRTNTIFVVQNDLELAEDITIPSNCILEFEGGSICGTHTITGRNTAIQAGMVKLFDAGVSFKGTWNVNEAYPEWFGATGNDASIDDAEALESCMRSYISGKIILSKKYYISYPVYLRHSVAIEGRGGGIIANNKFHSIIITIESGEAREVNALLYTPSAYFDPSFNKIIFDGGYRAETVCETFSFANQFRISDCLVQRFYGVGIYLAFSDNAYVRNTYVRYCNIGIGFGNNRINNKNPWDFAGESRGKTNHVLLDNNNVEFCNIGVYAVGGADMTIVNHLSGHNALWALYCKDLYNVRIDELYSEDDFCCNFFVEKDATSDPVLNSDKRFNHKLYKFFKQSPQQRALMFLDGNCSYVINTLHLSLYNLRLYEGCNTSLIENNQMSGIDAIIHAGSGLLGGININGKWVVNSHYKVNNVVKYNKYDVCCNMRNKVTPNITSLSSLRLLNYNFVLNADTIDRTPIIDRTVTFYINSPQNLTISKSDNNYYFSYKGTEGKRVNNGNYTYVKTIGSIDFYARGSYSNQVNSVRIDPSALDGNCTYAAIMHYYSDEANTGACGIDFWVSFAGGDGRIFRPCYYTPTLRSKQIITCIIYFTKDDFIKNGKLAQYFYFSEREGNHSLLSSPIGIWKLGSQEAPLSLSFKESGNSKSRPTPYNGEEMGLVYFDTTLGKPIFWTGNKSIGDNGWVDLNGNYPKK